MPYVLKIVVCVIVLCCFRLASLFAEPMQGLRSIFFEEGNCKHPLCKTCSALLNIQLVVRPPTPTDTAARPSGVAMTSRYARHGYRHTPGRNMPQGSKGAATIVFSVAALILFLTLPVPF